MLKLSLVYRTPGFHEFGHGFSSIALDQKLILGHPTSCFARQPFPITIKLMLKVRLPSGRRTFVIQAIRFGLLVLSPKF